MTTKTFNIRAYGLLISKKNEVLISREMVKGNLITKFPGGGLEFGEGLSECLIREFKEELDVDIQIISHFYTTDFFVESIFNLNSQVIAVYYLVRTDDSIENKHYSDLKRELLDGEIHFNWIPINNLNSNEFILPIDKHVVNLMKSNLIA